MPVPPGVQYIGIGGTGPLDGHIHALLGNGGSQQEPARLDGLYK